ncbi:MAG: hypothetical protein ABIQ53_03190 [Terracoccus sp.]
MTPATASLKGLAALGVGVALLLAGGAPGADAATSKPSLSIAIDNGRTSTTVGDVLVYTITVRNLGTHAADKLHIGQSLPPGLTFTSAKPVAKAGPGAIGWTVDLRPGATATLHSTSVVSKTAPDLLRLASVACASSSPTSAPIVCASHSDQLPAGALQAARQSAPAAHGAPSQAPWARIAGIAGGAAVVVAAVVLVARRRRLSPP